MKFLIAFLSLVSPSYAISTQCVSSSICASLSIPDTTVSSNTDDIYLQITGPTTYSWISFAQGTQMSGANYFVIYTSADGKNVTLSPRRGSGHNTPSFNSAAQVSLLAGSGISNGVMVANIKCSNCDAWGGYGSMNFSSASTDWIWGYKTGSPLNTDSQSASISQHDKRGYGSVTFDSTAQGGTGANPFLSSGAAASACSLSVTGAASSSTISNVAATTTLSSELSATASSASTQTGQEHPDQTPDDSKAKRSMEAEFFLVARGLAAQGLTAEAIIKRAITDCLTSIGPVTGSSGSTSNTGTSSGVATGSKGASTGSLITVHGILAGFIFTVLFPFGGIMIRLLSFTSLPWAHGVLQITGYIGYIISMGLGVYIATQSSFGKISDTHSVLGFVLIAVLLLQGSIGWYHHVAYTNYHHRTIPSYLHLWIGRLVIPIGMVNCVMGLRLSQASIGKIAAYCVVAAIISLLYVAAVVIGERGSKARIQGAGGEFQKTASRDLSRMESLELQARRGLQGSGGLYGSGPV